MLRGEITRSLQEAIARTFQNGFVSFLMESFRLIASDLIDGFIEFFHNVKAVLNVECFGKHFSNDVEVWLPHIRTNHLNLTTIIRPKVDEEIP